MLFVNLFNKSTYVHLLQQILLQQMNITSNRFCYFVKCHFVQQAIICSTDSVILSFRCNILTDEQMNRLTDFVMLFCCNRIFVATNEHNKSRGRALVCHAFIPNEAPIPPVAGAVPSILAAESMFPIRFHSVSERLLRVNCFHKLEFSWVNGLS